MRMPKDYGRVGILCGGWSAEREVSLQSGANVHRALLSRGLDVTMLDVSRESLLDGSLRAYDRVLNLMHGTGGEDGTVQAVLDLLDVPYPGCGVMASALAMDKLRTKRLWLAEGLPTPDFAVVITEADARVEAARLGWPVFVKPVDDGSSVGVAKVRDAAALPEAFADAARRGAVMIESFVDGAEYTCAVLGRETLPLIRIEPDGEFYDYHAKYVSDDTRYLCPAPLDTAHADELRALCLRAFDAVGATGWGRVDFMMADDGVPQLLEINTLPGMTTHSLVPMAAKAVGLDFPALCLRLLDQTFDAPRAGGVR